MKYKFAFLGCGNMGSALASAVCKKIDPKLIAVTDRDEAKADRLSHTLGCAKESTKEILLESEYIFIAVKPQALPTLLEEIKPILKNRNTPAVFITMCAAVKMKKLSELLGADYPIIRIMPNTPVLIGEGMTLYTKNSYVSDSQLKEFENALSDSGALSYTDEKNFDSESIISGCGPAYVYMFIEALKEAAIELGASPEKADIYAKRTALGAAKMALTGEKDLKTLRENVCSPGGTTIEGVRSLLGDDLYGSVKKAAKASYKRTLELSKD